jgi:hypothetical protein
VALIAVFAVAPPASADLLKEATGTVETVTSSLPQATPPSDPSASTPAPTPPPVQIQVPTPPKVSAPKVTVPSPVKTSPPDSPSVGAASSSGVGNVLAGSAKESVDTVAGTPTAAGPEAGGAASPGHGRARATSPASGARSVESRREAPLRRWMAYVWPAVALGPLGELVTGLQAALGHSTLPRIPVPNFLGLMSGLAAGTVTSDRGHSSAPDFSPAGSPAISLPGGEDFPLLRLLVSFLAFMGLLLVAVRLELGSPYRWWPH